MTMSSTIRRSRMRRAAKPLPSNLENIPAEETIEEIDRLACRDESNRPRLPSEGAETRFYGDDFKTSSKGVFVRRFNDDGSPFWEQISTTRMDIVALTRNRRGENWGTYVAITNRDGGIKKLAIPL